MGREIKRVPLDFDAPLGKEWSGNTNPHFRPCPADGIDCHGGYTAAHRWLDAVVRLLCMIGEEAADAPHAAEFARRGRIYPHPYLEEWGNAPRAEVPRDVMAEIQKDDNSLSRRLRFVSYSRKNPPKLLPLGPELVDLYTGLVGHPPRGICASNSWNAAKTILKAAGLDPETFGICKICKGSGVHPESQKAYDTWGAGPVPTGDGWQLWQTVSDGPISPVFATADELIDWMCQPAKARDDEWNDGLYPSMPWDQGWRREVAEPFVKKHGWAPSMVLTNGTMMSGAEAITAGDRK